MCPTFFGNYTNTPSADQSTSLSALTNNDLQIGVGTADHTGSKVNFAAANMKHVNGLAVVNLNGKTVPQTYYYDGNTGNASSVRAASTTTATVWPSVNFSSATIPYSASNTSSLKKYLAIVKPSTATTISTTATSGCEAWSLLYNVNQNTSSSKSVTSSRPGYYLGWVYSYKGEVETFTAPENAKYKLEVWGASGYAEKYTLATAPPPGKGGYSYGYKNNVTALTKYYICVGQRGQGQVCKPSYNNRYGAVPPEYVSCIYGGGATHIATTSNLGELAYYINNKDYVLLVAGGGGSSEWQSYGGAGGGERGLDGTGGDYHGTGASSTSGGTTGLMPPGTGENTYYVDGAFGVGGYGYYRYDNFNDYGAQGGGGWYGGGGTVYNFASGGGSGHVGDVEDGKTIAGNETFPSPSGGTETGHEGNGYAIITQVSY